MKKILILITKAESGGAQTSVLNLAKKLTNWGHFVTVGYGESGFLIEKLKQNNIKTIKFNKLSRSHNPLKNILFSLELKKYIKNNQFDAIHFNSTNTLFGAAGVKTLENKPKTIFTFRGLSILDKNYQTNFLLKLTYKLIFRFLLKFIDKKVFVSFENQKQAEELKFAENSVMIHNGLDESSLVFYDKQLAKEKVSELTNINLNNKFIIGSIGRLSYQKNYEFLIKNFNEIKKEIPNAICFIIGTGPNQSEYKELIKKMDLENDIILLGDISEAYKYLKAFDLFILPSRYEGLPIVLIETLFAGIPTISTNINGNKEVIENAGLFYSLDNTEEFIEKTKIIKEQKKRENLSLVAIEQAKKFKIEETAKKYLEIF